MANEPLHYIEIHVQVHPRSHRTALRFEGELLHVWVTAPPVEGAANAAVIALLAQAIGVARRRVALVHGSTARHKRLRIDGMTLAEVQAKVIANDQ